jgi:DNA polymerase III sliding clamp (beta) subunit (PCNA family)
MGEAGVMLVPAKSTVKALESIREEWVTLEQTDGAILVYGYNDENYESLPVGQSPDESPDEFPDVELFCEDSYHWLPVEDMQDLINHTVFAAGKKDDRLVLTGVCFEASPHKSPKDGWFSAVALDGRQLAWQQIAACREGNQTFDSVVVPVLALKTLARVLKEKSLIRTGGSKSNDDVKIAVKESVMRFQCGDVTIFANLMGDTDYVGGRFPKWRGYIPNGDLMHCAEVECGELLGAVKNISKSLDNNDPYVEFAFDNGTLTLTSGNEIKKNAKTAIPVKFAGRAKIRFVPKQIIGVLSALDADEVLSVYLPSGTETDSAMIRLCNGITHTEFTYIVMPLVGSVDTDVIPEAEAERVRKRKELEAELEQKFAESDAESAAMEPEPTKPADEESVKTEFENMLSKLPCGGKCDSCAETNCGFHAVTRERIEHGTLIDYIAKGYRDSGLVGAVYDADEKLEDKRSKIESVILLYRERVADHTKRIQEYRKGIDHLTAFIQEYESEIEQFTAELAALETKTEEPVCGAEEESESIHDHEDVTFWEGGTIGVDDVVTEDTTFWEGGIIEESDSESVESETSQSGGTSAARPGYIPLDSDGFVTWEYFHEHVPSQISLKVRIIERPYWYADDGVFRAAAKNGNCVYVVEWVSDGKHCDWHNPRRIQTLASYHAEQSESEPVIDSFKDFQALVKGTSQPMRFFPSIAPLSGCTSATSQPLAFMLE